MKTKAFPKQSDNKRLMKAEDFIKVYNKIPREIRPEKAILCFSPFTAKRLKALYKAPSFFHFGACWDFYAQHKSFVVSQFGSGAPAGLLQFEYLKALKVPLIFALGSSASFDKNLALGQGLFIEKAFYAEKEALCYQLKQPFEGLGVLKQKGAGFDMPHRISCFQKKQGILIKKLDLRAVTTVTCDIPYRFQKKDLLFWKSQGAKILEMEAEALMSAGQAFHIPALCFSVVSDFLDETGWDKGFSKKIVRNSLLSLLEKLLVLTPIEFYTDPI